jgi:CubicO group peptidase (beta-lactamase class C family)
MTDTAFHVRDGSTGRLAALYTPAAGGKTARLDSLGRVASKPVRMNSGGGGLLATAADYHRFLHMLLDTADSPAGELDGARLLSPRTVRYMGRNHLPGGLDLETFGRPLYAESAFAGVGFGLGFGVTIDPALSRVVCSEGELTWGGAASTAFWIDQREELAVGFYTQLLPSSTYRLRPQLRQLVYQAVTG